MIYAAPTSRQPRKYVVQVRDEESGQWATISQPVTRATAFRLRDRLNADPQIMVHDDGTHEEIYYHYRVFNRYTGEEST